MARRASVSIAPGVGATICDAAHVAPALVQTRGGDF